MTLLDEILERTRSDLEERRSRVPLAELERMAAPPVRPFLKGFGKGFRIIGEIKASSPSGGRMDPRNVEHALEVYNASPAIAAISILTNAPYFGGSLEYLQQARQRTSKSILRKDFIIDEYQVREARAYGADAVLLMASVHFEDPGLFARLYKLAKSLGLEPFIEIGMREDLEDMDRQISMIPADASLVGVNSRQFKMGAKEEAGKRAGQDLTTDKGRHKELIKLIPKKSGRICVAESGIDDPGDLKSLAELGYQAALIGTAFLKGPAKIGDIVPKFAASCMI
ncbi:MAG: hypothetical protein A3A86_05290 [Elusimicrobia bacterium RIFCSPLOWO2_01_FULL_60_11]|nr:MAG: hypothetical protein A3A86_05290 [Elusimicrobia bacterium RIFCSPLOWO2_01_FULL_60_11]